MELDARMSSKKYEVRCYDLAQVGYVSNFVSIVCFTFTYAMKHVYVHFEMNINVPFECCFKTIV